MILRILFRRASARLVKFYRNLGYSDLLLIRLDVSPREILWLGSRPNREIRNSKHVF